MQTASITATVSRQARNKHVWTRLLLDVVVLAYRLRYILGDIRHVTPPVHVSLVGGIKTSDSSTENTQNKTFHRKFH